MVVSKLSSYGFNKAGMIGKKIQTTVQHVTRSYVASPDGSSLINSPSNSDTLVIGPTFDSANDGVFYLGGSGPDQETSIGIYSLNNDQMRDQSIFEDLNSWDFTPGTGKWKFATSGYPYPILQWMPDNWMP
jgi:hypothetical protein